MSKSTGETVNPLDLIDRFGVDAFRYFLIREMNVGQDSEFSVELFLSRYNSDLANDLGNLVNRTLNMAGRYAGGVVPAPRPAQSPSRNCWRCGTGPATRPSLCAKDSSFTRRSSAR